MKNWKKKEHFEKIIWKKNKKNLKNLIEAFAFKAYFNKFSTCKVHGTRLTPL